MGYTTGSCAAAAAAAAAQLLLTGRAPAQVALTTPSGVALQLEVEYSRRDPDSASCAVRKDAGDDPDVTGGMLIFATVTPLPGGIEIDGGEGIGRVTRRGLACGVGEAAINPVPRRMIGEALAATLERCGADAPGGLRAVISAPQGAKIAERTFNSRLGIQGGISVLGTTGIVEPMSEAAMVCSIRAEIDLRRAAGHRVLLLTPGNYGQAYAKAAWGVALERGVKCSNFIGEALDYAVYKGFSAVLLLGHAGKLVKLAAGVMNTHSAVADARMEVLGAHGALAGLDSGRISRLLDCVSVEEADGLLREWDVSGAVWASVAARALRQLEHRLRGAAEIGFAAFLAAGTVMQTENLARLLGKLEEQEWEL